MFLDRVIPRNVRRTIMARLRRLTRWPRVGRVDFGDLRRLTPLSRQWGYDRGQPVDRHFVEDFLASHQGDVRGEVLEIGTRMYTRCFGGARVTRSEVLHVSDNMPDVTLIADLTMPDELPADQFDCVILTQTLQFIYDHKAALRTVHKLLKPGGVLLITVPGLAQISRADMDRWGDFWRFTTAALTRLLEETFPGSTPEVSGYGNVLTAVAFLEGVASDELDAEELDHIDPDFEVLVGGRVVKA